MTGREGFPQVETARGEKSMLLGGRAVSLEFSRGAREDACLRAISISSLASGVQGWGIRP